MNGANDENNMSKDPKLQEAMKLIQCVLLLNVWLYSESPRFVVIT
jgi:hypothetical protein